MLIGQYEGKIDVKGRSAFPKHFREILGDSSFVLLVMKTRLLSYQKKIGKHSLKELRGDHLFNPKQGKLKDFSLVGQ